MVRIGVDQQRFQWSEEQSRGMADATCVRPIRPELGAQLLQYRRGAWNLGAADFQPFEFGQQAAARHWRQSLQELLDPVAQCHCVSIFRARLDLLSACRVQAKHDGMEPQEQLAPD